MYNLVLKDIQELAAQAMKDADAFLPAAQQPDGAPVSGGTLPRLRRNGKRLEARNQEN